MMTLIRTKVKSATRYHGPMEWSWYKRVCDSSSKMSNLAGVCSATSTASPECPTIGFMVVLRDRRMLSRDVEGNAEGISTPPILSFGEFCDIFILLYVQAFVLFIFSQLYLLSIARRRIWRQHKHTNRCCHHLQRTSCHTAAACNKQRCCKKQLFALAVICCSKNLFWF